MKILDPILGGKIRGVLVTLFAVFVLAGEIWPELSDASWAGTVVKVYAFAVGAIEILTHGTSLGNQE